MYQRDYLLRLIQQMTEALGTIAGLRKEQKKEEALQTVDDSLGRFFRLNSKLMNSLSEKDLLAMMTTNDLLAVEQATGIAAMLKEEGDIYAGSGEDDESYPRYVKSLNLFLVVSAQEPELEFLDIDGEIAGLLSRLEPFVLPLATQRELMAYYERTGSFAKAEDALFDLLEASPGDSGYLLDSGIAFYERLLAEDDERLAAGNLPREEVEDGLATLKERKGGAAHPVEAASVSGADAGRMGGDPLA